MTLVDYAKSEFSLLGWPGDDKMQKMICDDILALLEVFDSQNHSGSSASYCANLFKKLVAFEPLSDLTGDKDEWIRVSEDIGCPLFQNKRDSEVFKDKDGAYWIHGKVFYDKTGSGYITGDSRTPVSFPWKKPDAQKVFTES